PTAFRASTAPHHLRLRGVDPFQTGPALPVPGRGPRAAPKGAALVGSFSTRQDRLIPPLRRPDLALWLAHAVLEALRLGQRLELLQRVVLDLADPLPGDAERLPDLFERARLGAVEPVAELDHAALAGGKRGEGVLDVGTAERDRRGVEGRLGLLVLDEVAELRVLLLADRLLERDRVLRHAKDLADLLGAHLELLRDLVRQRLTTEALHQLALDVHDLVELLDHVHGDPDRAGLVGDGAGHRLTDPPGGVGRELEPLAVVELLDGTNQAQRPLLDQVEEREPATEVALG